MTFEEAFSLLMGYEGGYSFHPNDPGGETIWGITKRVAEQHGYTGLMKDFPISEAKKIYKESYWDKVRADELPDEIRYAVFDAAVNSGVERAIKWLQKALVVSPDGILGPITLQAAQTMPRSRLLVRYNGIRLKYLTDLPTWSVFGKGWARRIAGILMT